MVDEQRERHRSAGFRSAAVARVVGAAAAAAAAVLLAFWGMGIVLKPDRHRVPSANASAESAPKVGAKVAMIRDAVDLGDFQVGETLAADVELQVRNTGDARARILDIDTTCSCTDIRYPDAIAPGETVALALEVRIGNKVGPRAVRLSVLTEPRQVCHAIVHWNVMEPFAAEPPSLRLDTESDRLDGEFAIHSNSDRPVPAITSVMPIPSERLTATIVPAEKENAPKVAVALRHRDDTRAGDGRIDIRFGESDFVLHVPVRWDARTWLTADRTRVVVTSAVVGTPIDETLRIDADRGFSIVSARVDDPSVEVETAGDSTVRLRWTPHRTGLFEALLSVQAEPTEAEGARESAVAHLQVPLVAFVRSRGPDPESSTDAESRAARR